MKKLLALLLALVMVLSLTACVSESTGDSDEQGANSADQSENNGGNTQINAPITFQETVVVDNDACTIKITDIDPDGTFGYDLSVYLENKTDSTSLMFSVRAASTNGVTNDPFFASSVEPGKKANETITFSDDDLADIIGDFTDIMLSFRVYDSNDWLADPVAEPTVHIYPYGEEKATTYVRQAQDTDTILFDNDKVTAIVTSYEEDTIWGYAANIYLVNKTDTAVMFSADDVSVNGFMCDPFFATTVNANSCAFEQISWSHDSLSENKIEKVEEIEMTMRAYDSNNWLADDFAKEKVTLHP